MYSDAVCVAGRHRLFYQGRADVLRLQTVNVGIILAESVQLSW